MYRLSKENKQVTMEGYKSMVDKFSSVEELTKDEIEMMLEFPGYIMPRSEYEKFIEEWEKDCEEERQLHRSFPY